MSVMIRGMKMPEDCPVCPLAHWNKLDCFTGCELIKRYFDKEDMETRGRPSFCPLVELPAQHGRLIDAYELAIEILKLQKYRFSIEDPEIFVSRKAVMQAISDNPTVIEAEEVKDG